MIPNIEEKKAEVKKIWLENRKTKREMDIYKELLGNYFDVANFKITHSDWLFFIRWVKEWKGEEQKEMIERGIDETSEEDILMLQDRNRKRMILMLDAILKKYEEKPKRLKNVSVEEVRRWYKALQSIEESMKRTRIAKGKLGLDAAKALLLPYQRLKVEDLLKLKEKLNESIERIIAIKSKRITDGTGQDSSGGG